MKFALPSYSSVVDFHKNLNIVVGEVYDYLQGLSQEQILEINEKSEGDFNRYIRSLRGNRYVFDAPASFEGGYRRRFFIREQVNSVEFSIYNLDPRLELQVGDQLLASHVSSSSFGIKYTGGVIGTSKEHTTLCRGKFLESNEQITLAARRKFAKSGAVHTNEQEHVEEAIKVFRSALVEFGKSVGMKKQSSLPLSPWSLDDMPRPLALRR